MQTLAFYWMFLGCFFLEISSLLATTYIDQSITVPTTWTKEGNPYMITEDVIIEEGSTLTIEEGCVIYFSQNTQLIVAGNLLATGSSKQVIVFEGLNEADWNGLIFLRSCNDYNPATKKGVRLSHCVFKGSQNVTVPLLRSKGCDLLLEHCQVDNCYSAIQTERQAELWLKHSTIKNCNRALSIRNTSIAQVQHNRFLNCNSILLGGSTTFEFNSLKYFTSNSRYSGLIVWMLGGGKVAIRDNHFHGFENHAINLHKLTQRSSVYLIRNDFKSNPINLKLSCQYYNIGTVVVEQNNFHNYYQHHVQVYDHCEALEPIIMQVGRNYWGKLSLPDLQTATADYLYDKMLNAHIKYEAPLDKSVKLH